MGITIPTLQRRKLRLRDAKVTEPAMRLLEFEPKSAFKACVLNRFTMSHILILLITCHLCARLAPCQARPMLPFQMMAGGPSPAISLFCVNKVLLACSYARSFTYILPLAAFVLNGRIE